MNESNESARNRVQYVANGRPHFFDDPAVDKLLAMTMALLGEVCVLRDRLDAHERLAASQGLFSPDDVDCFQPDQAADAERTKVRDATVARVMKILSEDVARLRDS